MTLTNKSVLLTKLDAFDESIMMDMKKSVGLRNVIVHEYDDVDWEIVNDVVKKHLQTFKSYAQQILEYSEI